MPLIRWEPFREMDALQREINHLFESLTPNPSGGGVDFMPAAELRETPEVILLNLEVPGIEPQDLEVEVTAEAVSISGERRSEVTTEEKGLTRSEFRYGSFRRVIPLPSKIKNDEAKAEYKNGILILTLPREDAEKNRVVKVQINS